MATREGAERQGRGLTAPQVREQCQARDASFRKTGSRPRWRGQRRVSDGEISDMAIRP